MGATRCASVSIARKHPAAVVAARQTCANCVAARGSDHVRSISGHLVTASRVLNVRHGHDISLPHQLYCHVRHRLDRFVRHIGEYIRVSAGRVVGRFSGNGLQRCVASLHRHGSVHLSLTVSASLIQIGARTYRGGQTRMDIRAARTRRCSGAVPQTARTATPRMPTHSAKTQTMRAVPHAPLHVWMTTR